MNLKCIYFNHSTNWTTGNYFFCEVIIYLQNVRFFLNNTMQIKSGIKLLMKKKLCYNFCVIVALNGEDLSKSMFFLSEQLS